MSTKNEKPRGEGYYWAREIQLEGYEDEWEVVNVSVVCGQSFVYTFSKGHCDNGRTVHDFEWGGKCER